MAILIILAILSAIMSTVSGIILSITSILVRDLWCASSTGRAREDRITSISRLIVLVVVAGSLAFVFWGPQTLVGLLIQASGPIMLQVLVVLAGGLFWKRATKEGAIISMLASETFLILLWNKAIVMPIKGIHDGIWAMALGVVVFAVVSLLTKPAPKEVLDKFFNLFDKDAA